MQPEPSLKASEDVHALAQRLMKRDAITIDMPRPRLPQVPRPFVPEYHDCPTHGRYAANMVDGDGITRWMPKTCQACKRDGEAERLMRRAAISPRFAGCSFSNFEVESEEQAQALRICQSYAHNFAELHKAGACLMLRGNPGTGKNHLASAIAKAVIGQRFTAVNVTAQELVRRIRETWHDRTESEADVIARFAQIDLLIIDEVGRQYAARDGSDNIEIFNVIDARYRMVKPTVILSNQSRDGIRKALGDAAYDRLREGGGKLVNFDWQSHRG